MRAKEFIKELFEPEFKNTKKTVSHNLLALRRKANKPGTQSGSFGYVVDTPNDPGTVTKTAYDNDGGLRANYRDEQKIDAYYIWVKLCARNNQMSANPYLPRVYVIDDREDENGLKVPRYQMEKLYAANNKMINSDMLVAIGMQIGLDSEKMKLKVNQSLKHYYNGSDPVEIDKATKRLLWGTIINAINYDEYDHSQEGLVEAVQLVNYIANKWRQTYETELWDDMHSGNFMIRVTNIGPQLVFTDPIAGALPYSQVEAFLKNI